MAGDWTSARGVSGGGGGRHGAMRRGQRSGRGVWRGLRRTNAGRRGRRCSGSTCQQRLSGEHRCVSRELAGDERWVKTQPGLAGPTTMFPLQRALSCRLIPQGCLPGENPVLALLSP
uniref:Uncharacterized protein n=1 Tax=Oryza barthii TaxID=65489 RepID=A0A0D3GSW5_9ORYZ